MADKISSNFQYIMTYILILIIVPFLVLMRIEWEKQDPCSRPKKNLDEYGCPVGLKPILNEFITGIWRPTDKFENFTVNNSQISVKLESFQILNSGCQPKCRLDCVFGSLVTCPIFLGGSYPSTNSTNSTWAGNLTMTFMIGDEGQVMTKSIRVDGKISPVNNRTVSMNKCSWLSYLSRKRAQDSCVNKTKETARRFDFFNEVYADCADIGDDWC